MGLKIRSCYLVMHCFAWEDCPFRFSKFSTHIVFRPFMFSWFCIYMVAVINYIVFHMLRMMVNREACWILWQFKEIVIDMILMNNTTLISHSFFGVYIVLLPFLRGFYYISDLVGIPKFAEKLNFGKFILFYFLWILTMIFNSVAVFGKLSRSNINLIRVMSSFLLVLHNKKV